MSHKSNGHTAKAAAVLDELDRFVGYANKARHSLPTITITRGQHETVVSSLQRIEAKKADGMGGPDRERIAAVRFDSYRGVAIRVI